MTDFAYPWLAGPWHRLQALRERLPHALLFHGPEGIGKTAFAELFAQALLCQAPAPDGRPCGRCDSCGWFSQYSHPDYRRVRPEVLDEDGGEGGDGDANAEDAKETKGGKSKASKTPSKEIKIDQVRALADFMNISTHRQGLRVVVLYPAEALNTASANALLKTLEEPPPGTVFLLVSHSLDRLLPTILSRCRKFALAMPPAAEAMAWLEGQGVNEADVWLAEQGGAPLNALAASESGMREVLDEFLHLLLKPGTDSALKGAEKLQKTPVPQLVAWLQRWVHDVISLKLSGRIRYYPRYRQQLAALADKVDTAGLLRMQKSLNDRRAVAEHPLAPRLVIEDMLLDYARIFPAQARQA
ncbi:DNA polymerase III subunit delta' [Noviherbaspirillum galbum]|uniref:DNA polymerase III subunit delta n=1 Tax=Noviherbaspirillum galbum TaxID=2709383 RepID=A0A6B3SFR9_9BURK|nr:DNA polymerase III subunit delta' [Noviherbaspirillum galbum]NEX59704.1 DNA polymerase III subunit delta' [Noviherbaspirillum galbum]